MGSGADPQSKAPHAPAPDDTSSDNPDPASPSGSASSPQSASASASAGAQPQQYDFYRMLPRFKVPVSHDDEHPAHAGAPPAATGAEHTADSGPSYVLQIGSYRSTAEADAVRARLARAGISAQVQRIVQGSSAWNRVRIGPLSDTELARVREQLRTANVHAMVIREDR
jgi:cell division protein FtsN